MEKTRRRYTEGEDYRYDFAHAREIRNSRVLNDDFQDGELDDLLEIKEEHLQVLEDELEDILAPDQLAKQIAFNKGQRHVEDQRRQEKRVSLEARIDVVKAEITHLEEAIEEREAEKEKHDKLPCLPRGPEGLNQVRGSTGKGYVDGQYSEHLPDVGLVITDERSPYRGILVMEYIDHVAKPYIRASREYNARRRKEDLAAGKRADTLPRDYGFPWPKWPAGVKNHLSNGKDTGQPVKLQRTRKPTMVRTK